MEHAEYNPSDKVGVSQTPDFDVYAAFSELDLSRKMILFDQLLGHRFNAYRNTMKAFWPESTDDDASKLEMMLRTRVERLRASSS